MRKLITIFTLIACICHISYSQIDYNKIIIKKSLSQQWELDSIHKRGTFRLVSYKPIYISAARWSTKKNEEPFSESGEFATKDKNFFNNIEAKLQVSFKTKVLQNVLFGKGDIWVAFSQSANWQVYNKKLSRAFRELNYEPEVMIVFPAHIKLLNGQIRTIGMNFNHQSNGKDIPTSRSWNRIIFDIGYEYKDWNVNLRPWYRLPDAEDENPQITKFIGDGELEVGTNFGKHEIYAIMQHSFSTFKYGNLQLNYVFPIHGHLRGHAQMFQGYGETLIDYNVTQTIFAIGMSFANW